MTLRVTPADRSWVLRRAWELANGYVYRGMNFDARGRRCFGDLMRCAWFELRALKALAARPLSTLAAWIAEAKRELADLAYRGWGTNERREMARINDNLREWEVELARRAQIVADTGDLAFAA